MIAKLEQLSKMYCTSAGTFTSNEKKSINLYKGEVLVITSQSVYSNKTLLTLMGCLVHPNDGIIEVNGKSCIPSNLKDIALIKQQTIGFIFKNHNLFENLNTQENIAFPLRIQKIKSEEIKEKTIAALKKIKMYNKREKMLWQLTHSEKQLIAIAKALIINPKIIICDKPTALLDKYNGTYIMKLLRDIASQGITIVILNHDTRYYDFADRVVQIKNGIVTEIPLI